MKDHSTILKRFQHTIYLLVLLNSIFLCFAQQSNLSKTVNHMSAYIASERFFNLKKEIGDVSAVDSIFYTALQFTDQNIAEALLGLMLATVPYRKVPVQVPLLSFVLYYPLTSADSETFLTKNENLPQNLFFDSPQNNFGDKDKLAHFFGSAFLSYESHLFDMGKLIGYFVEAFEESFKVQSSVDIRDLDVNDYGRLFGNLLQENKDILPSQIFLIRSIRFLRVTI